ADGYRCGQLGVYGTLHTQLYVLFLEHLARVGGRDVDGRAVAVRDDRDGLGRHDAELGVLAVRQGCVEVLGDLCALRIDAQLREGLRDRVAGGRLLRRDPVEREVEIGRASGRGRVWVA